MTIQELEKCLAKYPADLEVRVDSVVRWVVRGVIRYHPVEGEDGIGPECVLLLLGHAGE